MKINDIKIEMLSIRDKFKLPLTTAKKLELEEQKLRLIQAFEKELMSERAIEKPASPLPDKKDKKFMGLRKAFYYFLVFFGLLEDGIGSFLFAKNLLALIPAIPNPILLIGSAAISILNCILFYAFEASIFKDALGISSTRKERRSLIKAYTEQLDTVDKINKLLFDIKSVAYINRDRYREYAELALLFNQDIEAKKQDMLRYKETTAKKIFRWSVTGFGAIMTVAGTYFMAGSFIGAISIGLVGTPVGWVFTALLIAAGLGFYFAMQGQGMFSLINPEYPQFVALKSNLKKFEGKSEKNFQEVYAIQANLKQDNRITDPVVLEESTVPSAEKQHGSLSFFSKHPSRKSAHRQGELPFSEPSLAGVAP